MVIVFKKIVFALLLCGIHLSSVFAQTDTTDAALDKKIDSMRNELRQFVDEFFDVETMKTSLEIRKMSKSSALKTQFDAFYSNNYIPLQVSIFTKFEKDAFWSNLLTGKWKYSADGKIKGDTTINECSFLVDLSFAIYQQEDQTFKIVPKASLSKEVENVLDEYDRNVLLNISNHILNRELKDKSFKDLKNTGMNDAIKELMQNLKQRSDLILRKISTTDSELAQRLQACIDYYKSDIQLDAREDFQVQFINRENYHTGSVSIPQEYNEDHYKSIQLSDGSFYKVRVNSMYTYEGDRNHLSAFRAKLIIKDFEEKKLSFVTDDGEKLTFSYKKAEQTANFHVSTRKGFDKIFAYYDEKKIGLIEVVMYEPKLHSIHVISVNGATIPVEKKELDSYLQETFSGAVATFFTGVKTSTPFEFDFEDGALESVVGNGMTRYSQEMRSLRDAFFKKYPISKKNQYYVFVVDRFTDEDQLGYMPRGKAMGFIKGQEHRQTFLNLIAHELGHGIFSLEHTFPEYAKGSTNNLMDYHQNWARDDINYLDHQQWKEIQGKGGNFIFGERDASESFWKNDPFQEVVKNIKELNAKNGGNYQAIIHCQACEEKQEASIPDATQPWFHGLKYSKLLDPEGANETIVLKEEIFKVGKIQVLQHKSNACLIFYIKDGKIIEQSVYQKAEQVAWIEGMQVPALFVYSNEIIQKIECTDYLGNWGTEICKDDFQNQLNDYLDITTISFGKNYFTELGKSIQDCKEGIKMEDGNYKNTIFNYSQIPFDDLNKVYDLVSGNSSIQDPVAGLRHNTKAKLLVTDHTTSDAQLYKARLIAEQNENVIWINQDKEKIWELKSSPLPVNEEPKIEEEEKSFWATISDGFNSVKDGVTYSIDQVATLAYEGLDWAAKGIREAKIPAYVWNCNDPNYSSAYSSVYYYATAPIAFIQRKISASLLEPVLSQLSATKAATCAQQIEDAQVEFALLCGLWNGVVETAAAIPELMSWIAGTMSSEAHKDFDNFLSGLSEFKKENEEGEELCSGSWCAIKTGIGDAFDPTNCCQFAETIGEISLPIIVAFLAPPAGGAALKSSVGNGFRKVIKVISYLDNLGDPFRYAKYSLRYVNESVSVIRNQSKKLIIKIENGVFKGNIFIDGKIKQFSKPIEEFEFANVGDNQKLFGKIKENGQWKQGTLLGFDVLKVLEKKGIQLTKLNKLLNELNETEIGDMLNRLDKSGLEAEKLNTFVEDLATAGNFRKHIQKLDLVSGEFDGIVEDWKKFGDSPLRTNTKFLEYINTLPVSWKVTHNGSVTKVLDGNGIELAELFENLVKTKGGTKANGNWNKLLNKPPMKNQKYQIDDYLYETDELGRVKNVKGELQDIERGRLNSQQTGSVALKGGVSGDEGGHLIANILNGPGEQLNYLPQTRALNNGAWKEMEMLWKNSLRSGKKVEIDINPVFEGISKRPEAFEVTYWIDGNKIQRTFTN